MDVQARSDGRDLPQQGDRRRNGAQARPGVSLSASQNPLARHRRSPQHYRGRIRVPQPGTDSRHGRKRCSGMACKPPPPARRIVISRRPSGNTSQTHRSPQSARPSIFQSKDDSETGFGFQYKVILKSGNEEAAPRPNSFLGFWVLREANRDRRREPRVGKRETRFRFSAFPRGAAPGCGKVGISRRWRDSQGAVESMEKPLSLFHAFHGPVVSTAPPGAFVQLLGGVGDSILQRRNNCALAAVIFRAHSVSLIFCAVFSICAKLASGFKYRSASSSDFSFSYGVA